jgi:hypothetical protein
MIEAGQAIKAHGSAPTPAGAAAGGGTILFITPACRVVDENDTIAIKAAAIIITRRIACPRYRSGLLGQFAITVEYRRVLDAGYANSATVNNNSYEIALSLLHARSRMAVMHVPNRQLASYRLDPARSRSPALSESLRQPG